MNHKRGPTRVFILEHAENGLTKMIQNGLVDADNPAGVLIVYPNERKPARRPRAPRRSLPGGRRQVLPDPVYFKDIADSTRTIDELIEALRDEVIAA